MSLPIYPGESEFDESARQIYKQAMFLAIDDESEGSEEAFEAFVRDTVSSDTFDKETLLAVLAAMFHCQIQKEGYKEVFRAADRLVSKGIVFEPEVKGLLREVCQQPSVAEWFPKFCRKYS